jgi:hypothetical protein
MRDCTGFIYGNTLSTEKNRDQQAGNQEYMNFHRDGRLIDKGYLDG